MERKIVTNKNSLFATFLQLEKAQAKLINLNARTKDISLEMDTLFRYLWEAFVEKTEPSLSPIEVLRLNPYVGNQIKEILPDPFDLEGDEDLKEDSEQP